MINQSEINNNSKIYEVPTTTIDKDWALGHLLNAMFGFPEIHENFVFKGGTCLRKIYIENYRFSEDLDFTLLNSKFIVDKPFINKCLKETSEKSGIKFHLFSFKPQIFEDEDQGYEAIIKFWGANHKKTQQPLPVSRWQDKIKLDISFSERLIDKTEQKNIIHPYSDSSLIINKVTCYSMNEMVAEKLRSLIQRNRPRDIYDNFYFAKTINSITYPEIKKILYQKATNKNIEIKSVDQFVNPEKNEKNKRAWLDSLNSQLSEKQIPDFDEAYSSLYPFIEQILKT